MSYPEHFHTSYELIYVVKGKIKYLCNGEMLTAEQGQMYFIQPGQTHYEVCIEEPIDFYYLQFYYLSFNNQIIYFMPPPGDPSKQFIIDPDKSIIKLIKKIYEEAANKKNCYIQIIDSILLQMICLLKRHSDVNTSVCSYRIKSHIELVDKAITYIKSNFNTKFSLQKLANECRISTYYISHIFKEVTGLSPLQYSLHVKIEEAKILIDKSDMTMYEISEHLGFKDQYYFSRTFKNIAGIPPTQYSKLKLNEKKFTSLPLLN
jgi:AraC-like DNA-binding protein